MMAGGGLANVPVKFDFASGGIVAFANGGDTMGTPSFMESELAEGARSLKANEEQRAKKLAELEQRVAFLARAGAPQEAAARAELEEFKTTGKIKETKPPARSVSEAQATMKAGPRAAVPPAGLKAAAETIKAPAPRPQAPQPAAQIAPPAAPAAPAQPAPESMEAMLRAQLAKPSTPRTMEEVLAEQKAARAGAGMGDAAGLAQMDRIRQMQEQYEGSKPSGLDNLIRVFGQAGQYKGLSGLAPAYTANQQQQRSQDLAMAQKINELMGGVETTQRGEMKDIATGALAGLGTDRATEASRAKDVLSALGTGRGQDVTASTAEKQRGTQERGQDLQFQASMAQVNATLARTNTDLTQNQRVALADKAIDNVNNMIKADMRLSMQISKNPSLRDDLVRKETDRLLAVATGTKIPAAPGAASPGGTSLKYNPATGKIE
jgi:hypothetical protein